MSVIDFEQAKLDRTPHCSGKARCLDCRHEWEAVAPLATTWLECPACTLTRGRMVMQFERAGAHWHCNCGNDLFYIMPDGAYCPNCGVWSEGA